jgi:antitoxin MazE
MQTTIGKWGNSLALRLPRTIAADARLCEGTAVELQIVGDTLVVRPATRPRYQLAELLEGYRPEHRHEEIDWGPPVGREAW